MTRRILRELRWHIILGGLTIGGLTASPLIGIAYYHLA